MSSHSNLPRQHTVFANLGTACDAHLRTEESRFAHLYVMRNLHEVVNLRIPADDGRTHHRPVHRTVSADFNVIFDNHIAYLGNLAINAHFIGFKAESIGTDYHSCMQYATGSDNTVIIHLDPVVKDGVIADSDIIAYIHVRINLDTGSQTDITSYIGKGTDIGILRKSDTVADKNRLLNAFFARIHRLGDQLQQLPHGSTGILHQDEGSRKTAALKVESRKQRCCHKYDACFRFLEKRQIFFVCHKREMMRLRRFYRSYVGHFRIRIAAQLSA